jgi:predicted DNA-binding transcriptional regulator YafY
MGTNKNALIRYKILDKCFRNTGRRYAIKDLIAECNQVLSEIDPKKGCISRRQIYEDISFMESSEGWEIDLLREVEKRVVYYRYTDPTFSINNMPLNEIEINHLKSAIDILSQFKGMPQFEWINELIPKLSQGTQSTGHSTFIEFDSNQYLKGIEHLGELYNAVFYKKVLLVRYQPFESREISEITIHPYFLKQYNSRWFLFGYNPDQNKNDWILALDRIISISESSKPFRKNNEIDWNEYFEDLIGVTKPEKSKIENIRLVFKGRTGKYIETKPIHGSQKSKWINEDLLEVQLQLIINYELESLILSHADNVFVKGPKRLQQSVMKRLSLAAEQY